MDKQRLQQITALLTLVVAKNAKGRELRLEVTESFVKIVDFDKEDRCDYMEYAFFDNGFDENFKKLTEYVIGV